MYFEEQALPETLLPYEAYAVVSLTVTLLNGELYSKGNQLLPTTNIPTSIEQLSEDVVKKLIKILTERDIRWLVADRLVRVDPDKFFDVSNTIKHNSNEIFVDWIKKLVEKHQWVITHPTLFEVLSSVYLFEEVNDATT
jgi:hypothetical protein